MKENGHLYICSTDSVPLGHFAVGVTDKPLETGDDVPPEFKTIFYSAGSSLADRFTFIGVSRAEMVKGKNILLFLNTKNKAEFGI